jgi:hypothetical protein
MGNAQPSFSQLVRPKTGVSHCFDDSLRECGDMVLPKLGLSALTPLSREGLMASKTYV